MLLLASPILAVISSMHDELLRPGPDISKCRRGGTRVPDRRLDPPSSIPLVGNDRAGAAVPFLH